MSFINANGSYRAKSINLILSKSNSNSNFDEFFLNLKDSFDYRICRHNFKLEIKFDAMKKIINQAIFINKLLSNLCSSDIPCLDSFS